MCMCDTGVIDDRYLAFNKTSTRLPESIFVQFNPAVEAEAAPAGWGLEMFNDSSIILDPMDVPYPGLPIRLTSPERVLDIRRGL